jgi:DNA (cytosine-5)-methyltransferase 1
MPTVQVASNARAPLQSVELFTGAGGLGLATHLSGYHHKGLFEWNVDACDTLRANAQEAAVKGLSRWRGKINQGDVRDVSFEQFQGVDLVAGGPPCQPFSLGGLALGMEDQRDMIPQFIRAVREAQPRAFIMENVRGLARKSFATYLHYTVLQLSYPAIDRKKAEDWEHHLARLQQHHTSSPRKRGLAYNVVLDVLNAADYGVPQCRERLFIVGFRSDVDAHWNFPTATHSQARLIHDQWASGNYWERVGIRKPSVIQKSVASRLNVLNRLPTPTALPWKTVREAIADLPQPFESLDHHRNIYNHRFQPGARPYTGHTGSPIDLPSKTLKAGDHGVPGGENMIDFGNGKYRYFTIREAARIQTFPDTWHFRGVWSEAMRQLGNAVPVNLAKVVAGSVAQTLAAARH